MFSLFKKKPAPAVKEETNIRVQTIPADFYGGANPVIKFKQVEELVKAGNRSQSLTSSEKAILDKIQTPGAGQALHPANLFANRKKMILIGSGLFILFVVGAGAYYWRQAVAQRAQYNPPIIPVSEPPTSTPIVIEEPPVTPIEPTSTPTSTQPISLGEASIDFPSRLLADSADMDEDDVTDIAEEMFGTDPGKPDSDADVYNDGHEIFNLYNPIGVTPIKLLDSEKVKDFKNPIFGYSVYYPVDWAIGNVDPNYNDVLFSTITGESIEIRTFDIQPGESFVDWFGKWAPSEKYSDLTAFGSVFKEKGLRRNDYLAYYYTDSSHVYVMLYRSSGPSVINYRMVIKMMARSFRLSGNTVEIPIEQMLVPTTTIASSSTQTLAPVTASSTSSTP